MQMELQSIFEEFSLVKAILAAKDMSTVCALWEAWKEKNYV